MLRTLSESQIKDFLMSKVSRYIVTTRMSLLLATYVAWVKAAAAPLGNGLPAIFQRIEARQSESLQQPRREKRPERPGAEDVYAKLPQSGCELQLP